MTYLFLAIAIIVEVTATSALKASEEFTRLIPSIIVIVGYSMSFYLLTLVLRVMPIGITYAIWSGVGIVLVAVAGFFLYKQTPDIPAIIGMSLIIIGVAVIHLFSKTINH
ncbi:MAG: multidrug efflux SMR transporter [Gammaproteobacteria bacterium]|nr:multidrug efflux SMR transporter [Gammaproteobacteria bacterium]